MLRSRAVSPVEVVEAYLARIERLNPQLNAVVALAEDARERAREIEAALMRGDHVGRLAGVPVTVKDTIEVRGLRTTFGSRLRADYVPQTEGGALARLRAAGAIILGKTNASEMALDYTTDNPVYGRTNNPFDLARTPGGSSGGCAAAVSACMSAASLASDLVGSIRIPAHFCGVAGLKPTGGRMPRAGHFPPVEGPFSLGASLGPIARRVKDLSLFFDVLSGDATGQAGGDDSSAIAIESFSELRGRRVAFYTDDGVVPVTDETRDAVLKAAGALKDAGLLLVEARPPGVERATDLWLSLFSYATQRIVGAAYAGREEEAGAAARAIIERSGKTAPLSLDDYFDAWTERDRVRAQLLEWMESTPLVVAPVGAVPAFGHDAGRSFVVGDRTIGTFRAFSYAQAFNVFDLPAVCVPAGQTVEGLPIGVQIAGRPFQEREVLAAARVVEDALGGWHAPPVALS
jgi:Asp-tRNA(Asn)/Glu-tRNA(Gln) amidotransferase A subunit family amidase